MATYVYTALKQVNVYDLKVFIKRTNSQSIRVEKQSFSWIDDHYLQKSNVICCLFSQVTYVTSAGITLSVNKIG